MSTEHGLTGDTLTAEEAKALIDARETGVVDNTVWRDFSELATQALPAGPGRRAVLCGARDISFS